MKRTVSYQMALGLRRRQDSVAGTMVKSEWTRTLRPCEFLFMTLLSENLSLEGGKMALRLEPEEMDSSLGQDGKPLS